MNKKILLWIGLFFCFFGLLSFVSMVDCVECWVYDGVNNELYINYTTRFLKCNKTELSNEHNLRVFIDNQKAKSMVRDFSLVR